MSASLVGSEMCIRDRRSARQHSGRAASRSDCRRRRVLLREGRSDGFGSVSYTHLTLPTICSV
eukprot:5057759-Alexandrium_andersonii.AAC.1